MPIVTLPPEAIDQYESEHGLRLQEFIQAYARLVPLIRKGTLPESDHPDTKTCLDIMVWHELHRIADSLDNSAEMLFQSKAI